MRKLITLALVLIGQLTFAQKKDTLGLKIPFNNGKVVYERTFKANHDGQSSQFYNNSLKWFIDHYKSQEPVEVRDHTNGRVADHGVETLNFKGPLNREVPCKIKLFVEIVSKGDHYTVRISDIIYGYQEDPAEERTFFSAEDLIGNLTQHKYKNAEGINPVPFTKKQSRKALAGLTPMIDNLVASIDQTMKGK
jgi:hypothetical protein